MNDIYMYEGLKGPAGLKGEQKVPFESLALSLFRRSAFLKQLELSTATGGRREGEKLGGRRGMMREGRPHGEQNTH